jgi:hypothetical protein
VNEKALALVKKLGVTPEDNDTSKALSKQAAYKRAELAKLNGKAFDKAYIDNEVAYQQGREFRPAFERRGFTRIPSMPLPRLNIPYSSFDEYMQLALNSATRSTLRKKFRATEDVPIELQVSIDVTQIIDEIFPMYLNVYERSKLHFEKLTMD